MIVYDKNTFASNRDIDANGYLRVEECNISKCQLRPYLGKEIPNWREFGLEPDKIYNVYCPKEELEKAVPTFNNLPLTREHIEVDVDNVPKEKIVGSLGDHASFEYPYLKNNLIIYDKKDIDLVMSGKKKELSCGYRYTPVQQSGEVDGQHYDFIMTDIIGNHVALVKQGRAGRDVMVADSSKGILDTIKEKIMAVFDKDLVGDEFKESEHPRAKNGQFTNAGGSGSSLKDDKDVSNYWKKEGSKESQEAGNVKVMEKQLQDLRGMLKEAMGSSSSEGKERVEYLKKNIENLEKEIGKHKAGRKSEEQLIKEFQETSKEISKMLENEERLSRESKFSEEGKNIYEKHSNKLKELNAKKEDLDKQIKAVGSAKKDAVSEKKDVFKSRFSKHTVRRDDPNYKAQLSAAKNDLKEAISAFEKNVENQEEKFKWIEQQRLDMAKADLEDLEMFEKESSKETTNDAKLDKAEQEKVGVVMKEFKEGELKSGSGEKVTDPKQAIAIALSEAKKVKDEEIPEKQDEPEKAGDDKALTKGEEEMTEEVKEALAEEKVDEAKKEEVVEDACGKAEDKEIKACDKSVDKRALIDEIGGILKDKVDEELWRTVIKKAEELAYNDSEASADDEKKEELKEEEKAEEVKEEVKEEAKEEMAKDEAMVMDADAIRAEAREEVLADFKARETARKAVRKVVGDVDVFAFDSAEEIYKFACEKSGMDLTEVASYKDAFRGLTAAKGKLALDASPISGSNVECLKDIRIAY